MAELFRDSPQLMAALKDLSRKRVFRAQFGKLLPNAGKEFTQAELRQAFDLVAREKRGSAAGPDGHYITAEELRRGDARAGGVGRRRGRARAAAGIDRRRRRRPHQLRRVRPGHAGGRV
ncbi:unnamed protein product, partial [Heterosigma akashiwo]